jgi:small subunit ribosomal protein S8
MVNYLTDMYSRIRNGYLVKRRFVVIPKTVLNIEICRLLNREGFLDGFSFNENPNEILIFLKYLDGKPMFKRIRKINANKGLYSCNKLDLNKKIKNREIFIVSSSKRGLFITSSIYSSLNEGGVLIGKIDL